MTKGLDHKYAYFFPDAEHEAIGFGIWMGILQYQCTLHAVRDFTSGISPSGFLKYYRGGLSPLEAFRKEISTHE